MHWESLGTPNFVLVSFSVLDLGKFKSLLEIFYTVFDGIIHISMSESGFRDLLQFLLHFCVDVCFSVADLDEKMLSISGKTLAVLTDTAIAEKARNTQRPLHAEML